MQLGIITPNLDGIGNENVSTEALASSALRIVQLGMGRNFVVLVIPSRRLWVGDAPRRAEASRVHQAFIELLRRAKSLMCGIASKLMVIPFPSILSTTAIGTRSDIG